LLHKESFVQYCESLPASILVHCFQVNSPLSVQ